MYKILTFLLIFLSSINYNWASSNSPEFIIEEAAKKLFENVKENKEEYKKDITPYYKIVNDVLAPILDYDSLIKQILGKQIYSTTSEKDRKRFTNALQAQLIKVYSKTILEYSDAKITILKSSSKPEAKIYIVYTELYIGKGRPNFKVNYAMMKNNKDNKWKVVEVIADGIRLVKSLKNSLAPEIKEKGLEAVIRRLESEVT